jgi:hypothetical protein
VVPNTRISVPPSLVGAHTKCFSLPTSMPVTRGRILGIPSLWGCLVGATFLLAFDFDLKFQRFIATSQSCVMERKCPLGVLMDSHLGECQNRPRQCADASGAMLKQGQNAPLPGGP